MTKADIVPINYSGITPDLRVLHKLMANDVNASLPAAKAKFVELIRSKDNPVDLIPDTERNIAERQLREAFSRNRPSAEAAETAKSVSRHLMRAAIDSIVEAVNGTRQRKDLQSQMALAAAKGSPSAGGRKSDLSTLDMIVRTVNWQRFTSAVASAAADEAESRFSIGGHSRLMPVVSLSQLTVNKVTAELVKDLPERIVIFMNESAMCYVAIDMKKTLGVIAGHALAGTIADRIRVWGSGAHAFNWDHSTEKAMISAFREFTPKKLLEQSVGTRNAWGPGNHAAKGWSSPAELKEHTMQRLRAGGYRCV